LRIGIVGAGLFGVSCALKLADEGHEVTLFDSADDVLTKASTINQARLHTGMHYPRDFQTAREAWGDYATFIEQWRDSVREISQHYAIATEGSLVSPEDFTGFADSIGLPWEESDPSNFFNEGMVDLVIKVPESTVDLSLLSNLAKERVSRRTRVHMKLSLGVRECKKTGELWQIEAKNGDSFNFDGVVIASYSQSRLFAKQLELELPTIRKEVCEIILGDAPNLSSIGITVMDGQFWSTMPFGESGLHTLTSVPNTPLTTGVNSLTSCQRESAACGQPEVMDCNSCKFLPPTKRQGSLEMFAKFMKSEFKFLYTGSLFTLKAVEAEPDFSRGTDRRVSQIYQNSTGEAMLVLSGKLGSAPRLADEVAEKFRKL
jgi:hypothetical protein